MASKGADPFEGVSATELQCRGEPLEEPRAPAVVSSSTSASDRPKPSAAVQERLAAARERVVAARPVLRPTGMRPDRPEEQDASSPGLSASGLGTPS